MNDIFAALDRWWSLKAQPDLATGEVMSVGTLTAQILIEGSNKPQSCNFNGSLALQKGDPVLLIRPRLRPLWTIACVVGQSRAGSSVVSRLSPNNTPGGLRWANISSQESGAHSWSGISLEDLMTTTVVFNGGTPVLQLNGYVTPGASNVNLDIGWGEETDYSIVFKASILSTVAYTPLNIFDVGIGPLYGSHTFNLRAQLGTGGITPNVVWSRFKILEI